MIEFQKWEKARTGLPPSDEALSGGGAAGDSQDEGQFDVGGSSDPAGEEVEQEHEESEEEKEQGEEEEEEEEQVHEPPDKQELRSRMTRGRQPDVDGGTTQCAPRRNLRSTQRDKMPDPHLLSNKDALAFIKKKGWTYKGYDHLVGPEEDAEPVEQTKVSSFTCMSWVSSKKARHLYWRA